MATDTAAEMAAAKSDYFRRYNCTMRQIDSFFDKHSISTYESDALELKDVEKLADKIPELESRINHLLSRRDLRKAFEFVDLLYKNRGISEHARECLERTKNIRDILHSEQQKIRKIKMYDETSSSLIAEFYKIVEKNENEVTTVNSLNELISKLRQEEANYRSCNYDLACVLIHSFEMMYVQKYLQVLREGKVDEWKMELKYGKRKVLVSNSG